MAYRRIFQESYLNMQSKKWVFRLSLFVFSLLLSACASFAAQIPAETPSVANTAISTSVPTKTPTPTEVVVSGTITIWHSWEEPYVAALLKTIAAFQDDYPNVQFDVLYVPQLDLRASFEQAALEGGGPTVLIGPAEWGPSLYEKGLIIGVSDLVDPDLLNTLNPAAVGVGRYQGDLIGLPLNISGVVLYRNKRIISQPAFTFDELLSLAKSARIGARPLF